MLLQKMQRKDMMWSTATRRCTGSPTTRPSSPPWCGVWWAAAECSPFRCRTPARSPRIPLCWMHARWVTVLSVYLTNWSSAFIIISVVQSHHCWAFILLMYCIIILYWINLYPVLYCVAEVWLREWGEARPHPAGGEGPQLLLWHPVGVRPILNYWYWYCWAK